MAAGDAGPGRPRPGVVVAGLVVAAIAGYWAATLHPDALTYKLALPVFKNALINLGIFFVPFAIFVVGFFMWPSPCRPAD